MRNRSSIIALSFFLLLRLINHFRTSVIIIINALKLCPHRFGAFFYLVTGRDLSAELGKLAGIDFDVVFDLADLICISLALSTFQGIPHILPQADLLINAPHRLLLIRQQLCLVFDVMLAQ